MISIFDYIQKYPFRAKQLLGISYDQFIDLAKCAKQCHEEEQFKFEESKVIIHRRGGGRKELLSIPEEVCLCLFYLRPPSATVFSSISSCSSVGRMPLSCIFAG